MAALTGRDSPTVPGSPAIVTPADPARMASLLQNFSQVNVRVTSAATKANRTKPVRIVAVSKYKPVSDIIALHAPSVARLPNAHLHFGENYLQELIDKSRILPPGIRWHFIGALQSNKCVSLARDVRSLWAVESVDSEKKASLLSKGWSERPPENIGFEEFGDKKLRVYVQVNTSGEESKSGVEPSEAVNLCRFIMEKCPDLKLMGLMTIGSIARSKATTPDNKNEDFILLRETRDKVAKELGFDNPEDLELSMGMSEDFEGAVACGSDEVRVGTTIFGDRPHKSQAKVV
ncbi:Alanine racemase family protein [Aspergillus sclerotialis]|uniref:Pyridoxal phosphate homeostasis protein n=1 Tax=Aspergillus sclerotialis TaxID=2070753 RepID=A0A3A2ZXF2_9EURO|nr:Alanine racemase family protein [Aspergillus sclerotialis]